ncbi:hypothetical protein AG1IA_02685 [Rhizoctonia solani AG-1 IA]|uniref:Uncharacterized protein n=1 Tax=Thanatephorus cucumeris (strain AG1-IA) TaxID=983506 RepID=L8WYZ6_THACA|nr:hypothetical protein AG1IA_02685 [Rhizoctonia solani AG-1 IA]
MSTFGSTIMRVSSLLTLRHQIRRSSSQLLQRTSNSSVILHTGYYKTTPSDALSCTPTTQLVFRRSFATPVDIAPHKLNIPTPVAASTSELAPLEKYIYDCILNGPPSAPLSRIHTEYKSHAGRVLDVQLPYESRPGAQRRVSPLSPDNNEIVLVAHLVVTKAGRRHVSLSSGFALNFDTEGKGEQCILRRTRDYIK